MLTTKELEYKIKMMIIDKIPNVKFEAINFSEANGSSPEGMYVFAKDDKYISLYAEKGMIREKHEFSDVTEVLWNVLNSVLFDIAMEHATLNKHSGMDFRRALFSKEIELFSLFGEVFEKRKTEEIKAILLMNPYGDVE